MASRKQEHIEQIAERCLIAQKKNLVSRNELRETENIGATDFDELIANFLLQVCEFLFLNCVKKTISMKILVLRVINSSRQEIALYGVIFTRCLWEKPSLTRTSLVWVFTQTTREYNLVCCTFYDVNYMYLKIKGMFGQW